MRQAAPSNTLLPPGLGTTGCTIPNRGHSTPPLLRTALGKLSWHHVGYMSHSKSDSGDSRFPSTKYGLHVSHSTSGSDDDRDPSTEQGLYVACATHRRSAGNASSRKQNNKQGAVEHFRRIQFLCSRHSCVFRGLDAKRVRAGSLPPRQNFDVDAPTGNQ